MGKKKMVLPISLLTLSAAVIVVAFFLPWIKLGGSYAGYEIPDIANAVGKFTSFKSWTGKFDINVYLVYALFLVPLGAITILALSWKGRDATTVAWITAAMPLAGFVYGFIRSGLDIFSYIDIGGWLTIAAAGVMVLALLNLLKLPIPNK